MKKISALLVVIVLSLMSFASRPTRSQDNEKFLRHENSIPNHYIVVLDDEVVGERGVFSITPYVAEDVASRYSGKVEHIYKHALNGFSVEMSEAEAEDLSQDFRVKFVEEDGVMETSAVQNNPPSGLDRIDQHNLPVDASYTYFQTGAGVRVYVIDTGIRTTHVQFGPPSDSRALNVFDAFGGTGDDCNGHGTHVSGIIGGTTYGVAKKALLRGVRVLPCAGSGSVSNVIAGVDWVQQFHVPPAVANMSLGGPPSLALDNAVNSLYNAGVTVVVAANNNNTNACNSSPARVVNAITVGSTAISDARSSFSNFGPCLDLFAPGSSILSAWYTSNTASATLSGTSMSSPHVAGVAALYKQAVSSASPAQVRFFIVNIATKDKVTNPGAGSPNRLLYSLF